MKLSVIIPVYNEVGTLATVLAAVRRVPLDTEIIVVDGDSDDGTVDILKREEQAGGLLAIYQRQRNGRGGALREGLEHATGDVVVFQDADLELDPACFPDLIAPIMRGETNVVFGSRFLTSKPQMTFLQYWGNRVMTWTFNLMWGTRVTDVETCYQMFRRNVVQGMPFDRNDMSFTLELAARLAAAGEHIVEVPVKYQPREDNSGKKLDWSDGFVGLWVVLKYRFLARRAKRSRS